MRPLAPGDRTALRGMLGRLSKESIHRRFHMPLPSVPAWMLDHIMGGRSGVSLVAVTRDRIVGHAMYAGEGTGAAEMAIVVEDAWQSCGIGKELLSGLARSAEGRGVRTLTAVALGENRRVLQLVEAVFEGVEYAVRDGMYEIRAPLRKPDKARPAA